MVEPIDEESRPDFGGYTHPFTDETIRLARVMHSEMQYLWCGGRTWDDLPGSERAYFCFVMETVLAHMER